MRARAAGSDDTALNLNLGWCCYLLGRHADAKHVLRAAVERDPESVHVRVALAMTMQACKDYAAAIAGYESVLRLDPTNLECWLNAGICHQEQGALEEGERSFRHAIGLDADRPIQWSALGHNLWLQRRREEALIAFERSETVAELQGRDLEDFTNHSAALLDSGRTREVIRFLGRKLRGRPDPIAHGHLALAMLTLGDYQQGWRQYEFRWFHEPMLPVRPKQRGTPWVGQPISGKSILLRCEQGFGDIFQFVRYAPLLKKAGAMVTLLGRAGLDRLAYGFEGVDRVVTGSIDGRDYDFDVPLMSLPKVIGTLVDSIPCRVPYVSVDPDLQASWSPRLPSGDRLKVGVVWAGNPAHRHDHLRSIPVVALLPIFEIEGIDFVSLQKDVPERDTDAVPIALRHIEVASLFEDFADTAAVISRLDLIICVDTAIAHLAGALGEPVWLLLSSIVDFRWFEHREGSPWYPTMRIFRKRELGDWSGVVIRVRDALRSLGRQADQDAQLQPEGPPRSVSDDSVPESPANHHARADVPDGFGLAQVLETRHGILQYWPDDRPTADLLADPVNTSKGTCGWSGT